MSRRFHQFFASVAVAIVSIAIVWGFAIVGSPGTERTRKFDERRVQDFKIIDDEIRDIVYEGRYWATREERTPRRPLPQTLEQVAQQARKRRVSLRDPQTGDPYGFRVVNETHFELCADFALPRERSQDVAWNHPAGRHWFLFDVRDAGGPIKRDAAER